MAKKERDIFLMILKNFVNSLRPRKFTGELKGSDHFGNKYYEIEAGGSRSKNARYFEPIGKEAGFDREIPAEWDAWLRGRRRIPPTEEEVLRNYQIGIEKRKKAEEIDIKFKGPKDQRIEEPKIPTGRKSFPVYAEYEQTAGDISSKKR